MELEDNLALSWFFFNDIHLSEIVLMECSHPLCSSELSPEIHGEFIYFTWNIHMSMCNALLYSTILTLDRKSLLSHSILFPHSSRVGFVLHTFAVLMSVLCSSCSTSTSPIIIHIFPRLWVSRSWSRRVSPSSLFLPHKMFAVSSPGLQDQWTSPLTTRCPTPCRRQGTLTPPKSEYNGCPGFFQRMYSGYRAPWRPSECSSQRLYFHFLYFSQSVCVCVHGSVNIPALSFHPVAPSPECKMACLAAGLMMLSKERRWLGLLPICWKAKGKWHRCAPRLPFQLGACVI